MEPIVGVTALNSLEWGCEEFDLYGTDIAIWDHLLGCDKESHDDCEVPLVGEVWIGLVETNDEDDPDMVFWNEEHQIGLKTDSEATLVARMNEGTVQIMRSKWVARCAPCSPCYPGQGDLDTPGELVAYAPSPEIVGDSPLKGRVEEL